MKKCIALLAVVALIGVSVKAQENKKPSFFKDNTFVQAGIGLGMYGNGNPDIKFVSNAGFQWELMAGKWMTNAAALSIDLSGMRATSNADIRRSYFNAYVDFVWDPLATFSNTPEARKITINPYAGFGVSHVGKSDEYAADNDYAFHFGVQGNYRFTEALNVYLKLTSLFTPPSFDGNETAQIENNRNVSPGTQVNISVGAKYDIGYDAHRRRLSTESASIGQDWYFGASYGMSHLRYPRLSEDGVNQYNPYPRDHGNIFPATISLQAGKCFSPLWSIRGEYNGILSQINGEHFGFWNIHADVVLNLNFIEFGGQIQEILFQTFHYVPTPHEDRKFSLSVFAGCGLYNNNIPTISSGVASLSPRTGTSYCGSANLGLIARYKVGKSGDVFAEASYASIPPRMYGNGMDMSRAKSLSTGFRLLTVGYQYNIFGRVKRY